MRLYQSAQSPLIVKGERVTKLRRLGALIVGAVLCVQAQTALTWDQVKEKFESLNPTLRAAQLNVLESRAQEITAYLRPNPDFTFLTDGTQIAPHQGIWRPFTGTLGQGSLSYLHERDHKRELRLESAQEGTGISQSQRDDNERTLLFTLRSAFVQALQAKALLVSAKENLDYFDKEYVIHQDRFKAGDLSRLDLRRILLQRVQFEQDYQTALVNMRTAKISLLMLLDERTPIDQFDVTGPYDFAETLQPLEEFRTMALESRPDLKAALQAVDKAQTDHRLAVANGSTDPTFAAWYTVNPSFNNPYDYNTLGASVTIPLRIFDRNQGEKARTQIDIRHAEEQRDATRAQVFNDVDSAYYTVLSTINLLKPYKETYLAVAADVRDTTSFSFQHGQASLIDYLDAQRDYRATQVAYINLVGSYLTAAGQLNMAVGREVIR
jgi:outer membrane protein, heavy metal efflux system